MNIDKQKIINEYLRERNKVHNAYHVVAKLSSDEYSKFWKYCTKNGLNKNSAIKTNTFLLVVLLHTLVDICC